MKQKTLDGGFRFVGQEFRRFRRFTRCNYCGKKIYAGRFHKCGLCDRTIGFNDLNKNGGI
jgi:hypothetical protein